MSGTATTPVFQGVTMPVADIDAGTSAQATTSAHAPSDYLTAELAAHEKVIGGLPPVTDETIKALPDAVENIPATGTAAINLPDTVVEQLERSEAKDAKKMSRIFRKEKKTSDKELSGAIKEFGMLESQHKKSVKNESSAKANCARAARYAHKLEVAYMKAKGKYEKAQADVTAKNALLQTAQKQSVEVHGRLQASTAALENMRQQKAIEDRERSAKLEVLKGRS